jgi:hypothetical protein
MPMMTFDQRNQGKLQKNSLETVMEEEDYHGFWFEVY